MLAPSPFSGCHLAALHSAVPTPAAVPAGGAEASDKGLCEGSQWSSDGIPILA